MDQRTGFISTVGSAVKNLRGRSLRPYHFAVLILIAGHFLFLMGHFEPAASGRDANGYFPQARLIAEHGRAWFEPESPLQYTGPHWLRTADGRYVSHYPPGLGVLLAIPFKLLGPDAAFLVNPILTSLTLLGLFLVCRLWVGEGWALAAVLVMAVNPVAVTFAFAGDAHAATAFFLVWGLYFLARWSRSQSPLLAAFTGLWLGIIPTVRYPEALFGLGVGLFMALHWNRRVLRSLAAALAGALIPLSLLLIYHKTAFGSFWKTSYALTNEQTAFSWAYFARNAIPYLQNLQAQGAGFTAALGLAGMAALCARRDTRRCGLLLAGLVLPVTLLYMAYYFAPSGMPSMRFLLPTFYLYAIAGVWLLKFLSESQRKGAYAATVTFLLITLLWGLPQSVQALSRIQQANAALAAVGRIVTGHVPPGAIVIASMPIQQHLNAIGGWRLADETAFQARPPIPAFPEHPEGSNVPHPMQLDERRRLIERYTNPDGIGPSGRLLRDLHAWAYPERRVYWIGDFNRMKDLVSPSDSLRVVARIERPRPNRPEGPGAGTFGRPGSSGRFNRRRGIFRGPMHGGRGPFPGMFAPPVPGGPGGFRDGMGAGPPRMPMMGFTSGRQELILAEWTWPAERLNGVPPPAAFRKDLRDN